MADLLEVLDDGIRRVRAEIERLEKVELARLERARKTLLGQPATAKTDLRRRKPTKVTIHGKVRI